MDCTTAQQFVSELYDGEQVPREAIPHIVDCPACHACLQDYARITSEMRLLAAESARESHPPFDTNSLPARRAWLVALGKSVRVPRLVAALVLAALALVTAGWVRTAAQNEVVPIFWCEINVVGGSQGGAALAVGKPDYSFSRLGNDVYGWKTEVLNIRDGKVVLRIRLKHFHRAVDFDTVRKELDKIAPQQITYSPGQQITIAADGGGSAILSGSIRYEGPARVEPQSAAALLPATDEIDVRAPVLIRDHTELLADQYSAGTRFRCNSGECGFYVYVPRHGLFFFSTQRLPDGVQGTAIMSEISFSEGGHYYTLHAMSPITGGQQPKRMWVVHVPDYLPSQHGQAKSDDALVSLGTADLSNITVAPKK